MSAPASSSSAASTHSALAFFNTQPGSFPNLLASADHSWYQKGHAQLASAIGLRADEFDEMKPEAIPSANKAGAWLPVASAEQAEVESFIAWVGASSALVRQVVEVLPAVVHADCAAIASAELHDFSPKGRVDDEVFEKHRDVWEKITRGCAVIKILVKDAAQPIWRWAVRANRKFTGHEDDATVAADAQLYCVPGVPSSVVVSHKANGSVLHLAARDIEITSGVTTRWVFLGSKKVHVGCIWSGSPADWARKMQLFKEPRHEYVGEMVTYILPHLQSARGPTILALLARFRLVLNAEYVSAVGTGPTDNEKIYALAEDAREAYGFMLTFNTLTPQHGCELGLDMMAGLRLIRAVGFQTVAAFQIPLAELPAAKARVIPLADIEGAVLYYSSVDGLTQLEKWKSSNYVVLRAVREKLKPFVYGQKAEGKWPGLEAIVKAMEAQKAQSVLQVRKCNGSECQPSAAALAKPQKKNAKQRKKAATTKRNADQAAAAEEKDEVAIGFEEMKVDSAADGSGEEDAPAEQEQKSASSSAPAAAGGAASVSTLADTFLVFTHPQLDTLSSVLQAEFGATRVQAGEWRVACPADPRDQTNLQASVTTAFETGLHQWPLDLALQKTIERVHGRIASIDHIPMSAEERAAWLTESEAFLRWIVVQVVDKRRWPAKEVMELYSKLWTLFRAEGAAA